MIYMKPVADLPAWNTQGIRRYRSFKTDLGSYITSEYGLLQSVLSYLSLKDLLNASHVCSAWKDVVQVLLRRSATVGTCVGKSPDHEKKFLLDEFWARNRILPKVILKIRTRYLSLCRNGCDIYCSCLHESLQDISADLFGFDTEIIFLHVMGTIATISNNHQLQPIDQDLANGPCEAVLLFPEMPGVKITTFQITCVKDHTSASVESLIGTDKIECLLIYTSSRSRKLKLWIQSFINILYLRQGKFACGGGISEAIYKKNSLKRRAKVALLGIAFSGENVKAYSDIVPDLTDIEMYRTYFNQLECQLGPLPDGCERIALNVQCFGNKIDFQSHLFLKKFPHIPVFGLRGYGEIGFRYPDEIDEKNEGHPATKKPCVDEIEAIHGNTTSLVILTFKKTH